MFLDLIDPDHGAAEGIAWSRLLRTLFEQCVNSTIVAGITALGMLAAPEFSWRAVLVAGGIMFVAELRKYRQI